MYRGCKIVAFTELETDRSARDKILSWQRQKRGEKKERKMHGNEKIRTTISSILHRPRYLYQYKLKLDNRIKHWTGPIYSFPPLLSEFFKQYQRAALVRAVNQQYFPRNLRNERFSWGWNAAKFCPVLEIKEREREGRKKRGEREREEKKDDCERRLLCCQNEKFLFVVGGE